MTAVRIPPYPVIPESLRQNLAPVVSFEVSCPNGPDPGARSLDRVNYVLGVGTDWSCLQDSIEIAARFNGGALAELFGPGGVVCSNAAIGVALEWSSQKTSRRGLSEIALITKPMAVQSEDVLVRLGFAPGEVLGDLRLSLQSFVGRCGTPGGGEGHLANSVGLRLGDLSEAWRIYFDGDGSIFPLRQVEGRSSDPLWRFVVEDWEDATFDEFSSDFVALEVNQSHPSFLELHGCNELPYATSLFRQVLATWIVLFVDVLRERTEGCALGTSGNKMVTQWEAIGDVNGAYLEHMLPGSIARAGWELISRGELDLSSRAALLHSAQEWVDRRFGSEQGN